jgi:glycosyltransferase involved in cell wall biosynthesis
VNQGELSVLMVIEGEAATSQLVEQLLRACRPLGIRYTKVHVASLTFSHLDGRTIPLFVRCGDPSLRLWIELLRRAHHPYLYYIDDNFWEIQGDSPLARYYRHPDVRQSLEFVVSHANQVLTNSEVLASYLQRFSSRVRMLPAFFDFDLIEGCIREQTPELRIGFAGSPSRGDDLELIHPVIQPVLDRIPNAVFEFCGAMPPDVQPTPRIRFFEHTSSYADFIRFQAGRNWAIGVAPLHDHPANRAKTDNKYREYGGCGIAGVYSDMPPYRGSVESGVTGLLVGPSSEAWLSAILQLALQPDQREQIARCAEKDVRRKYCVAAVAGVWCDCIRATHAELLRYPSHLTRAYVSGFALKHCARDLRILRLQVQDAYRKGGVWTVLSKIVQRLSSGLVRALGLGGSG